MGRTPVCYACGMADESRVRALRRPRESSLRNMRNSPDIITSRENQWLKAFRAALRGTGPGSGEPIGIEGPKIIQEAIHSSCEIQALLVSEAAEEGARRILEFARNSETGIARSGILRTTEKLFATVAGTETPQGVAALVRQPEWSFDDILRGRAAANGAFRANAALVVVLDGLQDPGNVGTILRSAEAFGATGAVAARGTADPWSPKAIRASAGSALRLPLLRGIAIPVLMTQFRVVPLRVYAATSRANQAQEAKAMPGADLNQPCAIFVGNEGAGLSPEIERAADARISIPVDDAVESLNAGVAASIILYEAARQRETA